MSARKLTSSALTDEQCAATLTGAWNVEPPSYDALCAHTAALNGPLAPCTTDSAALDLLEKAVEALSPSLRELSLLIHSLKETAYKEHGTHDALCEFFEREEGWQVERRPYGGLLKTSFRATCTVGSGKGPVIGFNSEMDALPGIGHACAFFSPSFRSGAKSLTESLLPCTGGHNLVRATRDRTVTATRREQTLIVLYAATDCNRWRGCSLLARLSLAQGACHGHATSSAPTSR